MTTQTFTLIDTQGTSEITINFDLLIAVGFAGRDLKKTQEHIDELAEIGVRPPSKIPMLYVCQTQCLTRTDEIQVVGRETSGEVEYVIVLKDGEIFIGLGSDHTDRGLEKVGIFKAKQICAKPMAPVLWRYSEIKTHWDSIQIRSWQTKDGREFPYQDGTLEAILTVEQVLAYVEEEYPDLRNAVLFSGTVPVLNGFEFGDSFRAQLHDPVLGRVITQNYAIKVISDGLE